MLLAPHRRAPQTAVVERGDCGPLQHADLQLLGVVREHGLGVQLFEHLAASDAARRSMASMRAGPTEHPPIHSRELRGAHGERCTDPSTELLRERGLSARRIGAPEPQQCPAPTRVAVEEAGHVHNSALDRDLRSRMASSVSDI